MLFCVSLFEEGKLGFQVFSMWNLKSELCTCADLETLFEHWISALIVNYGSSSGRFSCMPELLSNFF